MLFAPHLSIAGFNIYLAFQALGDSKTMTKQLRKTGIDVLGDIPWGSHFCHFYQTKKDFVELLTAYFKAGLENNEYCLWATSNPFNVEKVTNLLEQSVPGFKDHLANKSFEIFPITEWYLKEGKFNSKAIVSKWLSKLHDAQSRGFAGMRIHANKGWLEDEDWESYQQYEKELSNSIYNHEIIMLCTYPLAKADASTFLDIVHVHGRVISTRKGEWKVLQDKEVEQIQADLKKMNEELGIYVGHRTRELQETIRKLQIEITERKKAEEQLLYEKNLSNAIIDSIPGLFALFDQNMRFIRWNKSFEAVSGYKPEEILALHGIDSFYDNEKDRQRTTKILADIFEKGSGSAEVRVLMKDGKPITVFFIGRSFEYNDKKCLITTGIDITEQKKTEAKFKTVIEQSLLGFYIISDEKFAYVNPQLAKIFGYSQEELINSPVEIVIHPDDREMVAENVRVRMEGEQNTVHYEAKGLKRTGETIMIEVFCSGALKEKNKAIMGTVLDVTERKLAEEQLRQSESLLAEAEHLAHVGSWSLDLRNQKVTWSDELYQIFGIKPSKFDHSLETVIRFSHPDDKAFIEQVVSEAVKTHKPYNFHYRIIRPDGEERVLHVSGAVITDDQGNAVRMYGAVQDVTESKQAEQMMKESYEQIRSLTEHLQNIREEERTHIAREIHDELGQQLTVLKMDVAWLSKKINGSNNAVKEKLNELTSLLDNTVQSVRRIASELRPSMLDDLGLAPAMEWHLIEFGKRSGIKTSFHEPNEELEISKPIKTGLFRILQESLTNVAKHSKATKVHVELAEKNNHLLLRIKDNGKGFHQQEAEQKKTLGILGMKERTAMMGGSYEIRSEPGKGTEISVDIPLPSKT